MTLPILSLLVFLPLIGGLIALALPRAAVFWWSLLVAAADLAIAVVLGFQFTPGSGTYQFVERAPWIPTLGLDYSLGIDGISLFLTMLTPLLTCVAIAASWHRYHSDERPHLYFALMLMLTTGIQGVFLASNVFLFYVFWEIMLVPAYLLIGMFGGPQRTYAAIKFVIFTAVGSLLMLAAVIGLAAVAGGSLQLDALRGHVPLVYQMPLFLAFAAAFAIKSPLFPFHSWLPDAYREAPTPVTVLLAGAMSKTGTYGFLRYCLPLFPSAVHDALPVISILIVIGILYGAMQALVQDDFKMVLAYSSISHIGVILLGIFALNTSGIQGGVLQMVNHGITTGALFLIAALIEQRTGQRSIRALGGLATRVPVLATVFCIAALSSLGLPGLNSFAGEFLALLGAFRANALFGTLGTLVVVPAAWYLLRFFQGVMEGPVSDKEATDSKTVKLADLHPGELAYLVPLIALIVLIGLFPRPVTRRVEPSVLPVLSSTVHTAPLSSQPHR